MAKRPDSFATRCHDYEELPSSRYMPAKYQYCEADSNDRRLPHPPAARATSPHSTVGSTENLCETNRFQSTYRKRQNPLYDSVDRGEKVLTKDKKKKGQCQVHCVALVVVALIAIVALVLAVLRMSGAGSSEPISASSTNKSQLAEALTKIQELEEKYASLIYKVQLLESKLLTDVQGINDKLDKQDTRLSIINRNVSTGLIMLKDNLTTRIDTVSKMEGPRGPPGAGNLTACEHRQVKLASDFDFPVTRTAFMPQTESDAKKFVILGVDCSTQGGTESFLEANMMSTWHPSWPWQYRCNCTGQQPGATKRLCILYWWQCPRVS